MKAFMTFCDNPCDGCLLVFAETANKARSLSVGHTYDWEYVWISARRVPTFDEYAEDVKHPVVDTNEDLPDDAPEFYHDPIES